MAKKQEEVKLVHEDGSPAVMELVQEEHSDDISEKERQLLALEHQIEAKKQELADLNDEQLTALRLKEEERVAKETEARDPWKKQREADERLVRVRFDFREQPGGALEFCYKKYPGETLKVYRGPTRLVDGHVYNLPLGVVKHLMRAGQTPEYKHKRDIEQDPINTYEVGAWRTRYTAIPLDFIADDELQSMQLGITESDAFQR